MKLFLSHSYQEIDALEARSLEAQLNDMGVDVFDHQYISHAVDTRNMGVWQDDIEDLRRSFQEAGLDATLQETGDPHLFQRIFDAISWSDVVLCIWSEDYKKRYWTQYEVNLSFALVKPILIYHNDNSAFPNWISESIHRSHQGANNIGYIKRDARKFAIAADDISISIVNELRKMKNYDPSTSFLGEVEAIDLMHSNFSKLQHPHFGTFEVAQKMVERSPGITADMNWYEIQNQCMILTKKSKMYEYFLPPAALWEFAARGGNAEFSNTEFDLLSTYNGIDHYICHTTRMDKPNAYGLYDMMGTMFEWCWDPVYLYAYGGWINPVKPQRNNEGNPHHRAVRGRINPYMRDKVDVLSVSFPFSAEAYNTKEGGNQGLTGARYFRKLKVGEL